MLGVGFFIQSFFKISVRGGLERFKINCLLETIDAKIYNNFFFNYFSFNKPNIFLNWP